MMSDVPLNSHKRATRNDLGRRVSINGWRSKIFQDDELLIAFRFDSVWRMKL